VMPCVRSVQIGGKPDQNTKETENVQGIRSPIRPLDSLFGIESVWVAPGLLNKGEKSASQTVALMLQLNGAQRRW